MKKILLSLLLFLLCIFFVQEIKHKLLHHKINNNENLQNYKG